VNFYRKFAGVLREVLQEWSKEDFRGLMEEKQWESGNEGWIMMLRGLGPGK